jgi:signal recognition particle subunit SRP19
MDTEKSWVLWPEYFDANLTRAQGRKVKKSLAVPDPNLEMLSKALHKLDVEFTLEEEKAYPGKWHLKKGRALVRITIPKSQLLVKVGEILVRSQRS